MDHFNATVKDGKLVNTRRGLQVSRQKFNGISFVNTSAQDLSLSGEQSFRLSKGSSSKTAVLPESRFEENGNNTHTFGTSTTIEQRKGKATDLSFVAETGQQQPKKQPQRRTTPKGQSQHHRISSTSPYVSSPDSRPSSRSSVVTPLPRAEEATFQFSPSPFPVPQRQQQQQFATPAVHHRQYYHAESLQVNYPQAIPSPSLPQQWPSTELAPSTGFYSPFNPSQSDWKPFHHFNTNYLPLQLYPYEDILTYNPARSASEESSIASTDIAAFHCVLMCGTIAEAVLNGQHHLSSGSETEARGFAYHISKICAILNKKLDGSDGGAVDAIALHCISMLAWMGCYVGRLDHWHMHMRGLQEVLDVLGGLGQAASLPAWVVRRMHKADLKGATALASTPYLPLTRPVTPSPTAAVLSPALLAYTSHTISFILRPLDIHPSVISTLTALSKFSSAIHQARQSSDSSIKFEPYSFTEELQSITYDLLTLPESLSFRHPTPPTGLAETLTSALRAASLLFLKELLPDYPRNLGGYTALLNLLRHHLGNITHLVSPTSRNNNKKEHDDGMLDPQLRYQSQQGELKQAVMFLCLIGDVATQRARENDCRCRGDDDTVVSAEEDYSRRVFRDCVLSVLGVDNSDVTDNDVEFVSLFDLRGTVGEGWDDRDEVRRLLETWTE